MQTALLQSIIQPTLTRPHHADGWTMNAGGRPADVAQPNNAVLTDEAERLLGGRTRDIRLSPELYAAFRDRSFKQTSKIVRSWMSWVIFIDVIALGSNLVLLSHEATMAMLLPAAFIPPAALSVHWLWGKSRPVRLLDYGLLAGLVVILAAVGMMGVTAGGEFHERYLSVMLFVAVSAIIIFNVSMAVPILLATAAMVIYLVLQLLNPALTPSSAISAFLFFSSGVVAMVVARHTITILAHRTFLLELRDAGRARELIEMNGRLEALSKTDPLTNLPNRRSMDEILSSLTATPKDQAAGTAVLMCDIDYFKRLNDHLGHAEGDRCLVAVSRALAETLRPDRDHVARFGGEEFLVVLRDVTSSQAVAVAERLRNRVAALKLPNPRSPIGRTVTISIGVAVSRGGQAGSWQSLVAEADRALYAAKAEGRNRVVMLDEAQGRRDAVA
jgi:diguanylate cyclase (GGDEF)-like protein